MRADAETERQIFSALDLMTAVVSRRQLDAAVALFEPSDDALLVGSEAGDRGYGPDGLREYFRRLFGSSVTYEFRFTERRVFREGDIVWLFADGFLVSTSDAGTYEHPYRLTGVLRRHGDTWLWAQYHGSEPAG